MKFFAVFLAFIVAAQASSIPGYSYWCSRNFCVFPTPNSYCYRLPFNRNWCNAKYYASCLREYPCPDPSSKNLCEEELTDINTFVGTIRTKLEGKRCDIQEALEKKLPAFTCTVKNLHCRYLSTFKSYLARVICSTSSDYANRVQKYEERLEELECDAIEKFNNDIAKIIQQIKCFHDQILASFKKCLETRKCRVEAYESSLEQKSCDIQEKYEQCLTSHMSKRKQWVICIFNTIYCNNIKTPNFNTIMATYQGLLDNDKTWYVNEFKKKIEAAVTQLLDCYRCNYKCYFNTGCYGFNRRSFSQKCKSLPQPPKYNYKLVRVGLFNPTWKGCPAPEPKEKTTETFEKQPYLTCITNTYQKYLRDLCAKVEEWKGKVTTWKCESDTTLKARISCMKPKSKCGKAPTTAEIEEYQRKLRGYADSWLNQYECRFNGQIDSIDRQWKCQIESWKTKAESYICKVKSQFDCCMASKCTKTSSYEAVLDRKICQLRQQLNKKLQAMLCQHKNLFNSFYKCSFGCKVTDASIILLKTDYIACVDQKVQTILTQFDDFWCTEKPKYLAVYSCGIKCKPKVSIVGLRTSFKWNFCKPSLSSFFRYYC